MRQILLAGLLGGIVYFVWGMLAWMVLPIHTPTLHGLPDESAVRDALTAQQLETGVYMVPWSDDEADWSNSESEWFQRHKSGPLLSIYYTREGSEPMGPEVILGGFVIDLLAAMLAAALLSCAVKAGSCCAGYWPRVGFVAGLGVFEALVGDTAYWNWMHFPVDYTIAMVVDGGIGWTLVGLVVAAIVKPKQPWSGDSIEPRA
jgi:hypothetical protein